MPLLRLDKASLHYGTLVLLDEVDFSVSRGDKIGLLGRNGVGKTTFLKVLEGEIVPESGERWLFPQCVGGLAWAMRARSGCGVRGYR